MIWRKEFESINLSVEQSIDELFNELKKSSDYIPFLAFGDFEPKIKAPENNPYIIDNRMDGYRDDGWVKALLNFINDKYCFENENSADSKSSIFFELMMYLHIWESRPFLRFLKRIANLIDNDLYLWKLEISDKKKTIFLQNQVLTSFKSNKLKVYEIITNGYEKQIRDAIAHNEYWHNWANPELVFENYKLNPKRISKLHYNDWTKRFCYTFTFSLLLKNRFEEEKDKLVDAKCINGFDVKLLNAKGERVDGKIYYDKNRRAFRGDIIRNNNDNT